MLNKPSLFSYQVRFELCYGHIRPRLRLVKNRHASLPLAISNLNLFNWFSDQVKVETSKELPRLVTTCHFQPLSF